jgi:hypothetical protein
MHAYNRRAGWAELLMVLPLAASLAGCGGDLVVAVPGSGACDGGLALDTADPLEAARAIGICAGVVSAAWVYPDGAAPTPSANFDLGHGVLPDFGTPVPREGAVLLALSTGTARRPSDPGYVQSLNDGASVTGLVKGYLSGFPPGYPVIFSGCPSPGGANDGIALEVVLTVPPGVTGFAVDFNFHSADYWRSACTLYTDQFGILADVPPLAAGAPNVALGADGNRVNASAPGSMQACTPLSMSHASYACPLGTASLAGTGFDGYGASGWLTASGQAAGPTLALRFVIFDSADGYADSTVLIDGFRWQ